MPTMPRSGRTSSRTRRFLGVAALAAVAVQAGSARALDVTRTRMIAAPPAAVWSIVGGFCDIARWHPMVSRCTLSTENGAPVRALAAAGGLGTLVERELVRDEAGMRYGYRLLSGPLPVKDYGATISVTPIGTGATVTWSATFEASGMSDADAVADIAEVYEAGLAGIAKEAAP